MQIRKIPYFSQIMSPELVHEFIYNRMNPRLDPKWRDFGSDDIEDYARWWDHVCGVACMKMILAWRGVDKSFWELLHECLKAGAYVEEETGIKGLIYRPFVEHMGRKYGIRAEVREFFPANMAMSELMANKDSFFIASVHPSIRHIEMIPPKKGGHLVLLHAFDLDEQMVIMHNPSGNTPATQKNARIPFANFENFYAERGIMVY